jgi:S-adenosylmethionine:tRNA ribosyltransferase-isomerase
MFFKSIQLSDFHYFLPEEKIAKFPLEKRENSRLLHFENGHIQHFRFYDLPALLPDQTLLFFNNTKVIPARMIFEKITGAKIEIFLLKPVEPSTLINEVMTTTGSVCWEAMIGNLKRWKENEILQGEVMVQDSKVRIEAVLENKDKKLVKLRWDNSHIPFVTIIEACGEVPLPPYLNRKAVKEDKPRYQTVYSKKEGAVAAPTAGLHFTDQILSQLLDKGIKTDYLTLHVGAGTFQPIKDETVSDHPMHSEQLVINKSNLENLIGHKGNIVAVGTTSMRTLESLYWFGVKLLNDMGEEFFIPKLFPYENKLELPTSKESFEAILQFMEMNGVEELTGSTEIFIMPGYDFKVCNGLLTNFHQPASTLILLVAAFTQNRWKEIYDAALSSDYRFLSYGDSNLLWHNKL